MYELKQIWTCKYTDAVVILRDQAEGHLLHQKNYIAAQLSVPMWSLNHSTGDVDWMSGSADDYLSSVNHISSEGRVSHLRVDGHWIGKTLTVGVKILGAWIAQSSVP